MATGILLCGLNGCGKSTLGRALARETGIHFIDNEDLFFARTKNTDPYADPRSRDEVTDLLMKEVYARGDFIFAAVKGDYGAEILPLYTLAVYVHAPKDVRARRVRDRSWQKFGNRMLPGGDLHPSEESFFAMAAARPEDYVETWLETLRCPILRIDGTRPVAENIRLILRHLANI